jgi:hypothetical protein
MTSKNIAMNDMTRPKPASAGTIGARMGNLALGFVGEFAVLEITRDLAIGLALTRQNHDVDNATEKSGASTCGGFSDKVARSDGGRDVSHGSSPFVGLDDSVGASRFVVLVVDAYIGAVRCFDHAGWNIRSMRTSHAECRARVAIACN